MCSSPQQQQQRGARAGSGRRRAPHGVVSARITSPPPPLSLHTHKRTGTAIRVFVAFFQGAVRQAPTSTAASNAQACRGVRGGRVRGRAGEASASQSLDAPPAPFPPRREHHHHHHHSGTRTFATLGRCCAEGKVAFARRLGCDACRHRHRRERSPPRPGARALPSHRPLKPVVWGCPAAQGRRRDCSACVPGTAAASWRRSALPQGKSQVQQGALAGAVSSLQQRDARVRLACAPPSRAVCALAAPCARPLGRWRNHTQTAGGTAVHD